MLALSLVFFFFDLCLRVSGIPKNAQKMYTLESEGIPEDSLWDKANKTRRNSVYGLKDEPRAFLTQSLQHPSKSTHTVYSALRRHQHDLKPRGHNNRFPSSDLLADSDGVDSVSANWISLERTTASVNTSHKTLPSLSKTLSGEGELESSLLSQSLLRYRDYESAFTEEDRLQVHQNYQTETGLDLASSAYQTTTVAGSIRRRLSADATVSVERENVHQNSNIFEIDLAMCGESKSKENITADHGTVVLSKMKLPSTSDTIYGCTIRIIGSSGTFLSMSFDKSLHLGELNVHLLAFCCNLSEANCFYGVYFIEERPSDLYSSTNCMELVFDSHEPFKKNTLLTFASNPSQLTLNLTFVNERFGFVTTPFFDGISANYPPNLKVRTMITLPNKYSSILISFDIFALKQNVQCLAFFDSGNSTCSDNPLFRICGTDTVRTKLFNTSLEIEFTSAPDETTIGFKMLFSFYTEKEQPRFAGSGRYNCTNPNYELFKQHVECNHLGECENNEDEVGCWYSSGKCKDAIFYDDRCYYYVIWGSQLTWHEANDICLLRNSDLASLNTIEEMHAVLNIIGQSRKRRWSKILIGLRTSNPNLPRMYKKALQWNDGKLALDFKFDDLELQRYPSCGMIFDDGNWKYDMVDCSERATSQFLCEFYPLGSSQAEKENSASSDYSSILINGTKHEVKLRLPAAIRCPDGHMTHDFLSCDPTTDCFAGTDVDTCETENGGVIPLFTCEDGVQTIAFTLVCNHQQDCRDGSDEDRCVFEACEGFLCDNLQCIRVSEVCDGMAHCLTGRDEDRCSEVTSSSSSKLRRMVNTSLVTLDGYGHYDVLNINQSQQRVKSFPVLQ